MSDIANGTQILSSIRMLRTDFPRNRFECQLMNRDLCRVEGSAVCDVRTESAINTQLTIRDKQKDDELYVTTIEFQHPDSQTERRTEKGVNDRTSSEWS